MAPAFSELSATEKKQGGQMQQLKSVHFILTLNLRGRYQYFPFANEEK